MVIRHFTLAIAGLTLLAGETITRQFVHSQEQDPVPPDLRTRTDGEDWPAFLGPRGDSVSTEKGILTDWDARPPRIVWQTELGQSYGNCTVARGRCFQFDRVQGQPRGGVSLRETHTARLRCLGSETGKLLWTYTFPYIYGDYYGYNNGPRCSPLIDGNRVYIYGVAGQLHCVNVTTGKKVWSRDMSDDYGVVQNFFGVGSTPVIHGDLLLVMVGGSPADAPAGPQTLGQVLGNGTCVVAVDKMSGEERYRCSSDLASYAGLRIARIQNRDWGFAFARSGLTGFDPNTGNQRFFYPWRAKILESVNASCPVILENEVLISETYGPGASLLRIDGDKAEVAWRDDAATRAPALQAHWNTPVQTDGYVYASSGRHASNAELRCIAWKSGQVMWSEPNLSRSSILLADGHLITQAEDGNLLLVRATPKKYELVSKLLLRDQAGKVLLREPAWAAPILSHGLLYVRGKDRLVCLELIPAVNVSNSERDSASS